MRGADHQQMPCSVICWPEMRARKYHPPLRAIRAMVDENARAVVSTIRHHVCQCRASIDTTGETVASAVAADAVVDPQRAFADGIGTIS
jgi:hypothetical protein